MINPQFRVPNLGPATADGFDRFVLLAFSITSDLGRLSYSEGLSLANVGSSENARIGYADSEGKLVINPQFRLGFPFLGDLALVQLEDHEGFAWIDKAGKIVWRMTKNPSNTSSNTALANAANMAANAADTAVNVANTASNSSYVRQRTGRLTTDSNIRSDPNTDSASLGIHFKGAKVRILEETSFTNENGELSTWFKIRVYEAGCSVNANLGCGKNSQSDSDEGWVNAKNVLLD